jgi:hypothetical protein
MDPPKVWIAEVAIGVAVACVFVFSRTVQRREVAG